jgi:hypothetical protein
MIIKCRKFYENQLYFLHIYYVSHFIFNVGYVGLYVKIFVISSHVWGVRGRVDELVDFSTLAPHRCGFKSQQGLWILTCVEASQLAYGTSVVLLRCSFMPEIMYGRAPDVFFPL